MKGKRKTVKQLLPNAARQTVKRYLPDSVRSTLVGMGLLSPPPLEDILIHEYRAVFDRNPTPRLSLIIPTIDPSQAFGGITTGLNIFFEVAKRLGSDIRIIVDQEAAPYGNDIIYTHAESAGIAYETVEVLDRVELTPAVLIREKDLFFTYTVWSSINVRSLTRWQQECFGGDIRPYINIMQDYEPHFWPFSSTQLTALMAYEPESRYWAVINSNELYRYFIQQGHRCPKAYVFEPKLSVSLRPFLSAQPPKERRILVYGRPWAPRNCFHSIERALKVWAEKYPELSDWEVVSAGHEHGTYRFGPGRSMRSLGKLPLEEYGRLLQTTAVGLSLMCSPHPSYPPLEMAHFGVRTITNRYAQKDLSKAHDNIISMEDIAPVTIADALAQACREFTANPNAGWLGKSHRSSYLEQAPWPFLEDIVRDIRELWEIERPSTPL